MTQNRTFKMHPALLFSVIQSQAGTLQKAILESVMNSIDAGASRVDITLDGKSYTVKDDGRGFSSRTEIESFFETFGTPHQDGDAVYGKFRMGRGQGFAFAINQWKTGEFEMYVDIKGKGLDYILKEKQENLKGCHIHGELYNELIPSELLATQRALTEQCLYTPIPVFLNGKQISKDVSKEKWDFVTEEAYIKLIDKKTISIYNLGVLVSNFHAYEFGVGGIVVSRKQLDLNFARNDVMRNSCLVWKKIKPFIQKESNKRNKSKTKVTEEWRHMRAADLMVGCDQLDDFWSDPLFTDISGKHYSFSKLIGEKLTEAEKGDFQADRVSQHKMAIVLDSAIQNSRFQMSFVEMLEAILQVSTETHNWRITCLSNLKNKCEPLENFTKNFKIDHEIIEPTKLNDAEKLILRQLNNISGDIAFLVGLNYRNTREIGVMDSETALAFTNGIDRIWLKKSYLSGDNGPKQGLTWALSVVKILVHEYIHDFNSGVGHIHDSEFYQKFHDTIIYKRNYLGFDDVAMRLFKSYVDSSIREKGKIPAKISKDLDLLHKSEKVTGQ